MSRLLRSAALAESFQRQVRQVSQLPAELRLVQALRTIPRQSGAARYHCFAAAELARCRGPLPAAWSCSRCKHRPLRRPTGWARRHDTWAAAKREGLCSQALATQASTAEECVRKPPLRLHRVPSLQAQRGTLGCCESFPAAPPGCLRPQRSASLAAHSVAATGPPVGQAGKRPREFHGLRPAALPAWEQRSLACRSKPVSPRYHSPSACILRIFLRFRLRFNALILKMKSIPCRWSI